MKIPLHESESIEKVSLFYNIEFYSEKCQKNNILLNIKKIKFFWQKLYGMFNNQAFLNVSSQYMILKFEKNVFRLALNYRSNLNKIS
jgi:hypothetical protein